MIGQGEGVEAGAIALNRERIVQSLVNSNGKRSRGVITSRSDTAVRRRCGRKVVNNVHRTEGAVVAKHRANDYVLRNAHLKLNAGHDNVHFFDVRWVTDINVDELIKRVVGRRASVLAHGKSGNDADLESGGVIVEAGGLEAVCVVCVSADARLSRLHGDLRVLKLAEQGGTHDAVEFAVGRDGRQPSSLALAKGGAQKQAELEVRGDVPVVPDGDGHIV